MAIPACQTTFSHQRAARERICENLAAWCLVGLILLSACKSAPPAAVRPAVTNAGPTSIRPENFVRIVDNPWFPLTPGTKYVFKGTKDGEPVVDDVVVTSETKIILGVTCLVVKDTLTVSGHLAERTEDWYVQDTEGNVWYFGEATEELDSKGKVKTTEGSWQAGVDGARPGIIMAATPEVGVQYRQEYYKGHAEDHFEVTDLNVSVKVPYASYTNAIRTKEWTPLEPGKIDRKYYVRDVGVVKEAAEDGSESLELVEISHT